MGLLYDITPGVSLIASERSRQRDEEGYTIEHDRMHSPETLVDAAKAYLEQNEFNWPWDIKYFKLSPDDRIKELTKAGALIAAALDQLCLKIFDAR